MSILDKAREAGLTSPGDEEAKKREQDLISFGYYQGVLAASSILKSSPDDDEGMTEAEIQRTIEMLVKRLYDDVISLAEAERRWGKKNLRQPGVPILKWKLGRNYVTSVQAMIQAYGPEKVKEILE